MSDIINTQSGQYSLYRAKKQARRDANKAQYAIKAEQDAKLNETVQNIDAIPYLKATIQGEGESDSQYKLRYAQEKSKVLEDLKNGIDITATDYTPIEQPVEKETPTFTPATYTIEGQDYHIDADIFKALQETGKRMTETGNYTTSQRRQYGAQWNNILNAIQEGKTFDFKQGNESGAQAAGADFMKILKQLKPTQSSITTFQKPVSDDSAISQQPVSNDNTIEGHLLRDYYQNRAKYDAGIANYNVESGALKGRQTTFENAARKLGIAGENYTEMLNNLGELNSTLNANHWKRWLGMAEPEKSSTTTPSSALATNADFYYGFGEDETDLGQIAVSIDGKENRMQFVKSGDGTVRSYKYDVPTAQWVETMMTPNQQFTTSTNHNLAIGADGSIIFKGEKPTESPSNMVDFKLPIGDDIQQVFSDVQYSGLNTDYKAFNITSKFPEWASDYKILTQDTRFDDGKTAIDVTIYKEGTTPSKGTLAYNPDGTVKIVDENGKVYYEGSIVNADKNNLFDLGYTVKREPLLTSDRMKALRNNLKKYTADIHTGRLDIGIINDWVNRHGGWKNFWSSLRGHTSQEKIEGGDASDYKKRLDEAIESNTVPEFILKTLQYAQGKMSDFKDADNLNVAQWLLDQILNNSDIKTAIDNATPETRHAIYNNARSLLTKSVEGVYKTVPQLQQGGVFMDTDNSYEKTLNQVGAAQLLSEEQEAAIKASQNTKAGIGGVRSGKWDDHDTASAVSLGLDTLALGASFFAGPGTIVAGILGILATGVQAISDATNDDVTREQMFTNLGINVGLTAMALVPGGAIGKLTKGLAKAGSKGTKGAQSLAKVSKQAMKALESSDDVIKQVSKAAKNAGDDVSAFVKNLDGIAKSDKQLKPLTEVLKVAATETGGEGAKLVKSLAQSDETVKVAFDAAKKLVSDTPTIKKASLNLINEATEKVAAKTSKTWDATRNIIGRAATVGGLGIGTYSAIDTVGDISRGEGVSLDNLRGLLAGAGGLIGLRWYGLGPLKKGRLDKLRDLTVATKSSLTKEMNIKFGKDIGVDTKFKVKVPRNATEVDIRTEAIKQYKQQKGYDNAGKEAKTKLDDIIAKMSDTSKPLRSSFESVGSKASKTKSSISDWFDKKLHPQGDLTNLKTDITEDEVFEVLGVISDDVKNVNLKRFLRPAQQRYRRLLQETKATEQLQDMQQQLKSFATHVNAAVPTTKGKVVTKVTQPPAKVSKKAGTKVTKKAQTSAKVSKKEDGGTILKLQNGTTGGTVGDLQIQNEDYNQQAFWESNASDFTDKLISEGDNADINVYNNYLKTGTDLYAKSGYNPALRKAVTLDGLQAYQQQTESLGLHNLPNYKASIPNYSKTYEGASLQTGDRWEDGQFMGGDNNFGGQSYNRYWNVMSESKAAELNEKLKAVGKQWVKDGDIKVGGVQAWKIAPIQVVDAGEGIDKGDNGGTTATVKTDGGEDTKTKNIQVPNTDILEKPKYFSVLPVLDAAGVAIQNAVNAQNLKTLSNWSPALAQYQRVHYPDVDNLPYQQAAENNRAKLMSTTAHRAAQTADTAQQNAMYASAYGQVKDSRDQQAMASQEAYDQSRLRNAQLAHQQEREILQIQNLNAQKAADNEYRKRTLLSVNNLVADDNRKKAIDNAKQLLINTKAAKDYITNKIAAHDMQVQLQGKVDELEQTYGDIIDTNSSSNPTYQEMLKFKETDPRVTGMDSPVPGGDGETFAQKAKRLSEEAYEKMAAEYQALSNNLGKKYYQNLELGMPLGFTIRPKQSTRAVIKKAKGGSLSFRERAELIRMRETLKALQKQNNAIEKSLDRQQKHLEKILDGASKDNAQILRKIL